LETKKQFFDRQARDWHEYHTPDVIQRTREIISSLRIGKSETILEGGCGNGYLFPILRESVGDHGTIVGIDISLEMLKLARDADSRALVVNARAEAIPLKPAYFDRAIALASFPHFADKSEALKEICRPGGKFNVIHLLSSEEIKKHHEGSDSPVAHDILPGENEFRAILSRAGLGDISIEDIPGKYLLNSIKIRHA
jgi:ubiquinone/menaquinone biosynthesis C-methylase UbiE